jgi:hypothetical protein
VLFLAANPVRAQQLQLGEECRVIEDRIRSAKFRDQLRFRSRWAARPDDLLQALNEDSPSVLHFSGHGAGDQGLCFQAEDGTALSVSADVLAGVMRAAGASIVVVFLNACYSETQAQALVAHIPCIIGMSGAIGDEAAISYAASFYRALAFGKSVANAHEQGLVALGLPPTSGSSRDVQISESEVAPCPPMPRLLTRPGTDADSIYIVPSAKEKTRCTIIIKATVREFDADALARVTEELRQLSGDFFLQITEVAEGSVRLTVKLSTSAAKKLAEIKAKGRLTRLGGFEITGVLGLPEAASVHLSLASEQYGQVAVGDHQPGARGYRAVDERFAIEQLAGFGGMGRIYRARDWRSGALIALKVMHDAERLDLERFAREAVVLATLSHPGIVRYFDSGITAEGEPYLVMEWLSGETLSSRLQRTQLTLSEALALGRRVASALSAIHRRGVVHCDIKPSNLFLRDGAIDKVTLIDFGMARRPLADPKVTVTGRMLGTPGYIAPEQVDHFSTLDGRADIFSLGCVLYRCISGRVPFRGPDALRMLLNGLPRTLPRLREFRPSIPRELDDLVARMLSRSPEDRPASGDAVAAELLAIEESESSPRSATQSAPRSVLSEIMVAERRLMSLVVVRLSERTDGSLTIAERAAQERTLHELIERHRGKLEVLTDGLLLVILSNADAAIDLASRAARCALALQQVLGPGAAAVVTGRDILGPSLRDSELLHHAVEVMDGARGTTTVRLDELTCALLHPRFDTGTTGRELCGERLDPVVTGTLPGALEICVGREQELDQLEMIFDQCTKEHAATMVLLSGPDGVGKSRLGHEFLRRLAARERPPRIWTGVADPLSSGSVFGLLVQVLRRALDLGDDEPLEARRDKVRAWAARHPGAGGRTFAETLGELIGTPFETDDRDEPGARDNPKLPSEQMRQSFVGVLGEECAAQPVVIVLEDLHWGDLSTINLMYAALGALSGRPLMVLALARNNVTELFPQLWADRCVQEIRLRRLSRRASAQLVRQALGDAVAEDTVRDLVERSDRHASYLQELIRAAAAGNFDRTPPAVLAMVQARLEKLDPSARRVLRAASIFGTTFWRGGVEELIGGGDTAAWLAVLVDQGVVELKNEARFADEIEYRFQHTLIREAAYETLTSDDCIAGHWLAAQWLERLGEDPAVVAEHFERCGRGREPDPR